MEFILEILSGPTEIFRKMREAPKSGAGFFLIIAAWLNFLISILLVTEKRFSPFQFILLFFIGSLFLIISLFFKTTLLHFFAELFGGEGKVTGLFSALCLSTLPLHLSLPLTLIAQGTFPFLVVPFWVVLFFWSGSLGFNATKENYQLSTGKTILVGMSPSILFMVIAILLFGLLLAIFSLQIYALFSKFPFAN